MQNKICEGNALNWKNTTGSDVKAGDVVEIGDMVGIAATDIANGKTGAVHLKGVYEVKAKGTDVIALGATLYWDSTAGEATLTSTDNPVAGKAYTASADGVTTVQVRLSN